MCSTDPSCLCNDGDRYSCPFDLRDELAGLDVLTQDAVPVPDSRTLSRRVRDAFRASTPCFARPIIEGCIDLIHTDQIADTSLRAVKDRRHVLWTRQKAGALLSDIELAELGRLDDLYDDYRAREAHRIAAPLYRRQLAEGERPSRDWDDDTVTRPTAPRPATGDRAQVLKDLLCGLGMQRSWLQGDLYVLETDIGGAGDILTIRFRLEPPRRA